MSNVSRLVLQKCLDKFSEKLADILEAQGVSLLLFDLIFLRLLAR